MTHLCVVTDLFGLGCTIAFIAPSDDTYSVLPFLCPGAILGKLYKIPGTCSDPPCLLWDIVHKQCQQLMQSVFCRAGREGC